MGEAALDVRRAGSDGLLAEVADLDEALALFASLRDRPPVGVRELVPAARTVLVRFDPARTSAEALAAELASRPRTGVAAIDGPVVEVPVLYDGEDLDEVARLCGLDAAEVVRRHTAHPWTVAFTGFAPGFGYLSGGDPALDVPRRTEPRTAIPAGSVGLAGRFSGIYPRASPGGWQLIGRTGLALWDLRRPEPALLAPGMRVQFVDAGPDALAVPGASGARQSADAAPGEAALEVLTPGPLTVVVDLGRPGRAAQGVARSGAVDRSSFRRANRLVGNPSATAALEVAVGGLRVRALRDLVVAVTGAPAPLTVVSPTGPAPDDSSGAASDETGHAAEGDRAFTLDRGAELRLGPPSRGMVSYLAVPGGVAGEPVLGSLSTDLLSGTGPAPLRAGDVVRVGRAREAAAAVDPEPGPLLPGPDEVTVVDVLLGPRDDWFTTEGLRTFLDQEWTVTPRSNRVGLRLEGEQPLERSRTDELPSEGTVPGSVQVPPNGQPVVFTADHPVTGGYPVVACVAGHDLDRVGQVPVGGRIRFRVTDRP
ncbi:5-oxoprolinase/urea amidolyase family protein [Microlunatus spumicola]|uniref:5-oxoprolinase/urea amidolyase family protein n=1 Tax=Microlunatus spumicola TaxID=81499 RepID=A0ABP6WX90_9ACTN